MSDIKKQLDLLCQNTVDVIDREDLFLRLEQAQREKRPMRVKAGFDPSAPDIHLGHTVLLRKLRQFQDFGHKVVFIVGDYTAMIGDPTGQSKTRPVLSKEQIDENAKTYQEQAFKVLDSNPEKIEIVRNSQWLDGPDMFRILFHRIAGIVTIDQLLERDDFDKRRKAHRPIAVRELIYPMMQGYDSVAVKSDVELGGTDQKFNLLMGRDLQSEFGQKKQIVMTLPLLVGLDGAMKMSKSLGNYIAVMESPKDMFGKVMSIPDSLMKTYFDLLVGLEQGEENIISEKIRSNPRGAKEELAGRIVSQYHGTLARLKETEEFNRVFSRKEAPENPDEIRLNLSEPIWIVELLRKIEAVSSGAEARRLIEQGAVSLDGKKITDPSTHVALTHNALLQIGKKKFIKLIDQNK